MINETVAHYKILRKLGAGGMGVVYEAEDTKLGRRVALKFLPEESRRDSEALERFLREARAASSLSHPSICTIHAIEEFNDRTFISMELLDGNSLDKVLAAGAVPINRTIELGIQLADALHAAHRKGIVHRDIKPANIFLTGSGVVKILDFGLVKLLPEANEEFSGNTLDAQANTLLTSPGMAVGTIQYMSPEQARGEEIDARSDLFSLGAVLYQMLTGKQAFPGSTSAVVFDNILHNSPVSPLELNAQIPDELERILNKALEKDRDIRYQVAAELRADLKRLQRQSDSGSRPASGQRSGPRTSTSGETAVGANLSSGAQGAVTLVTPTPASGTRVPSGSGSVIVAAATEHKVGTTLAVVFGLLILVAAAFGIYAFVHRSSNLPFEHFSITKLTNNGQVSLGTISPDSKYLLHVLDNNGPQSLWLLHIPTGSNTQVVAPMATQYQGLTFSPDGNYIYFVRRDESEQTLASLYRAPVLGGSPQLMVRDVDSPITFSPDGHHFAFLRENGPAKLFDLIIAHDDGSLDRRLFSNQSLNMDSWAPAWSPNGKNILLPVVLPAENKTSGFLSIDAATAKQQMALLSDDLDYLEPVWTPDGSGLLVAANSLRPGGISRQLGIVSYPSGSFRELTSDTNRYARPSIAADGKSIAANQILYDYPLYVAPANSPDAIRMVPLSSRSGFGSWDWTADGRIVLPQPPDVRVVNPDGGENVIYTDANNFVDQVTACGSRYLVFRSGGRSNKASFNLWRIGSSGAGLKQLTFGLNEANPRCSGDGNWIYFNDFEDNRKLKRIPIDGGLAENILDAPVWSTDVAPDNKTLAIIDASPTNQKIVLKLYSLDDKKFVLHDLDQRAQPPIRMMPDGKGVAYTVTEKGVDNVWIQPLDSRPFYQLTHFTTDKFQTFRFSRDGLRIAFERGHTESDAVLLRDTSR